MNKIYKIYFGLIFSGLFVGCVNNKNQHEQALLNKSREIEYLSANHNVLKSNLYLMSELSCTYVNKEIQLVSRNAENFLLRDILSDSISHILFIPPMFCYSCNENVLKILPDIVESFGNKLKIICYPVNVNSVINFCKKKISYDNLFVTKERVIEKHEKLNKIYILSLTNLGQIKSVFLINDTDMKAFEEYLEICLKIKPLLTTLNNE